MGQHYSIYYRYDSALLDHEHELRHGNQPADGNGIQ